MKKKITYWHLNLWTGLHHLTGLVHVSEVSWDLVQDVRDILSVGDSVKAKIINIDRWVVLHSLIITQWHTFFTSGQKVKKKKKHLVSIDSSIWKLTWVFNTIICREKSRITLSIKQLEEDPLLETLDKVIPQVCDMLILYFSCNVHALSVAKLNS